MQNNFQFSQAKPIGVFDYSAVFYTKWFDVDSPDDDGVEMETLEAHMGFDRVTFKKCYNPLGIEVVVKATNEMFVASANENADGRLVPTHSNVLQGFMCEDAIQTIDGLSCPDVKVRYKLRCHSL